MDTESKATKLHYIPGCIKWKKSINTPAKKDQCSLCINYHPGSEEVKRELQEKFDIHVGEKEKVRELKNESKKKAMEDASIHCATFDLQQVMYLPMSRESSIFYKRRLPNYNFTFYNISNKDCHCFLWD